MKNIALKISYFNAIFFYFKGVCALRGSACTSSYIDPSHVLLAIGVPHELAYGLLE